MASINNPKHFGMDNAYQIICCWSAIVIVVFSVAAVEVMVR
jgi:hypothetical protein